MSWHMHINGKLGSPWWRDTVGSNSTCIAEESEEFCQLFSIRCFNEIPHTRQVRAQLFPQSLEHYKVNPVLEPEMEGGILKAGSRVSQKWPNRWETGQTEFHPWYKASCWWNSCVISHLHSQLEQAALLGDWGEILVLVSLPLCESCWSKVHQISSVPNIRGIDWITIMGTLINILSGKVTVQNPFYGLKVRKSDRWDETSTLFHKILS